MSLDSILSKEVLVENKKFVKKEFGNFLFSQKYDLKNNGDTANLFSVDFLTNYYSFKKVLNNKIKHLDDSIQKMYCSALSSELLVNNLEDDFLRFDFSNFNFVLSDFDSNLRILKNYTDFLKFNDVDISASSNSYFFNLKNYLSNFVFEFVRNDSYLLNLLSFEKKSVQISNSTSSIPGSFNSKKSKIIDFVRTYSEDIVGNVDVKSDFDSSMRCLFLYDASVKKNPALVKKRFNQFYLLTGEPGNGKGMVGAYAATIGSDLSLLLNKDFKVLTLNTRSTFQDGPVIKLKEYFDEISNSDSLYLVLVDELDSLFSSRLDSKSQSHSRDLVTELLKFTSSPLEYINKGNYVFVGITNNVSALDPAFLNRMNKGIRVCEGPKSAEEKGFLVKKLISDFVPSNKIMVKDWKYVGDVAFEIGLSARELVGCVESLLNKSGNGVFSNDLFSKSFEEKLAFFDDYKVISQDALVGEFIRAGENRVASNYLLKGGYVV